jgi:MFS family permease
MTGRLLIVCLTVATAMTTTFMLGPLVPIYAAASGYGPSTIGALVSLMYLAPLFLAIPIGRRIDILGVRRPLLAGALALAVLPLIAAARPELWALAVLQLGAGTAQVTVMISGQAAVAGLASDADRLRNLGWYTTAIATGQLVGPVLAGSLADLWGYPAAFAVSGSVALLAALGVPFVHVAVATVPTGHAVRLRTAMTRLWRRPQVRVAMLASSVVLMTFAVNQAFLPVLLGDRSFSPTAIGALFSLMALASLFVRPFVARIVGALGGTSTAIVACTLIVGLGALAIGLAPVTSIVVLAAVLIGAGSGVTQPTSIDLVLDGAVSSERGAVLGLRIAVNRVAQLAGPLLLGLVAQGLGARAAFVGVAVIVAAAASFAHATRGAATRGAP